ncbi:MAG: glycosyltransferase family 2 protein [Actinomycetota bacterium]
MSSRPRSAASQEPLSSDAVDLDLSVVIVNYNAGDYLLRCIETLLARTGGLRTELLVIDNASRDGSAQRAAERFPEVRLIANPDNLGLSVAWNQGIRETTAPWVFLPNPDVELWEGTLADLVAAGQARPDAAVVGPLVRDPDGTMYASGRKVPSVAEALGHAFLGPFAPGNRYSRAYRMTDWDRNASREVDWVSGSCMLVRRTAVEEVGLFDESFFLYAEELDLTTRLRDAGWKIVFTPTVEVLHAGGVSTGRSRRTHLMHSQSIYRYYAKHRADGWRRATLPLAWTALRARAEIVSLRDRMAR